MKLSTAASVLGLASLLSGCVAWPCGSPLGCPRPSNASAVERGLPVAERDAYLKSLSVEQRLDVYHDSYIRIVHPRYRRVDLFEGTGSAGFDAALARIVDRRSFEEYFAIAAWLARNGEVDVCDHSVVGRLKDKVDRFGWAGRDLLATIPIDRCKATS